MGRPAATGRVTAAGTALGTVALAAYSPPVGFGALAGAVIAAAIVRATDGRRHALPAAMLSAGVLGLLMWLVVVSGTRVRVAFAVIGIVLGLGGGALTADGTVESLVTLERVALQGLVVAVAGLVCSVAVVVVAYPESVASLVAGGSARDLALLVLLTGLSVAAAVETAPPAMFPLTDNRDEEAVVLVTRQVAVLLGLASVVLATAVDLRNGSVHPWLNLGSLPYPPFVGNRWGLRCGQNGLGEHPRRVKPRCHTAPKST